MVKIVPNQDFLDEATRYKKGKEYEVDAGLALYFRRSGWLVDSEGVPPAAVDLDVQGVRHAHKGKGP